MRPAIFTHPLMTPTNERITMSKVKNFFANAKTKIAAQFQDKPLETSAAAISVVAALGSALNAWTKYQNSNTWRREVKRREKLNKD